MIGTININVAASQPQKPTAPLFSFRGSPSSIRVLDCPKQIGNWAITRVYIDVLYPDNTTKEVDCVRTGNVWVGTFDGSTLAGRVTQGYQIKADGVDENENPIAGYVLGCGDVYILDDTNELKALVGKTALRMLDDIPSDPAKGDVVIVNGALKIYDGEEWYTVEVDLSDYYTKEEIDETVAEIDSSISALAGEIPTKTSDLENDSGYITSADIPPIPTKTSDLTNDSGFLTSTSTTITDIQDDVDAVESSVSELNTTVGQIQNDVSALDSSLTELDSTVSTLDGLAVKYDDAQKTGVHLGVAGRAFTLSIPDNGAGNGKVQFRGVNHISRNSMTLGVADTGETVGNTHVQLGDSHAPQAQLDIGANVQILSFNEQGKSQILIDGERLVVVTPEDVAEGKTLVATYVPDTPINSLSMRKGETMAKRDNPEGHWEYVSADLPSKTSDLTNDSGFITEDDVADKRDYDDLTYGGTYDPTDAEGYYGITSWNIAGYKYNGQTEPAFNTATRGKNNPTYGTYWNNGGQVIYTSDFSTFYLDGFGNAEPVPFTLSLDKTIYEVSFMGDEQQNLTLTANCANADRLALNSQLAPITASVSALGSSVNVLTSSVSALDASVSALGSDVSAVGASVSAMASALDLTNSNVSALGSSINALGSQVSALASSMSAKRDYTDLTYSTTVPSETIDNSELHGGDTDVAYNAKLTFTVNDSVKGEEHLVWNDGETCWIDNAMQNFMVWYAEDFGYDPADGKFVLVDGADACLQFNLQDGVNVQTFNYESGNYQSTGTLTMTFTGEPAHQVNDTLALNGAVEEVSASVSTLTSQVSSITTTLSSYATISYVDASIQDAIGAMLSSQL